MPARSIGPVVGVALTGFLALALASTSAASAGLLDLTPTAYVYAPLVIRQPTPMPYTCPTTSSRVYAQGAALQWDKDNPVRPAYNHADKNLALRSYALNTDAWLKRELVNYGADDPQQPLQFATLFQPYRVPALPNFYRVHDWYWAPSPEPGTRGPVLTTLPVTALGLETTRGEPLQVPVSDYQISEDGLEVLVLFADADSITLRYTREDSSGSPGYTLHIDHICTDPALLALYNQLDDPDGPRYDYPSPSYDLPVLRAGETFGTARGSQIVVAVSDTGAFMDPRSCNEWWQVRPRYGGTCPTHE